jgi:hypothetical protein
MTSKHLALAFLIACNGGGGDGNVGDDDGDGDCDSCAESELCVIEFAETNVERCEAIPEVCGGTGDCTDTECQSAMYDYCPEETSAWGCSDTFPPTLISCNL